jgi:hypothetical protein
MKKKTTLYLVLGLFCILKSYGQQIVINEVQYTNRTTITDSFDQTPDWIEIYNNGDSAIHLQGYSLTDELNEPEKGFLPDTILNPQEYLLVFASDDSVYTEHEIHVKFKLKLMHDTVYLIDPYSNVIDLIEPTCVPADNSLGRLPDGADNLQLLTASPAETNNNAEIITIDYKRDSLTIDKRGGFYENSIQINLSKQHETNEIYYSLDSDDPDERGELFKNPISLNDINGNENRFANQCDAGELPGDLISKASILRAQIYSEGCPASNEISATYFIGDKSLFDYDVPVVSIITDENNLFDEEEGIYTIGNHKNYSQHGKKWERPIHIEVYDNQQKILDQDAGMRIHGRGSRAGGQKSLRLYARDEYGNDSFSLPILSQKPHLTEFKTLLLRGTRDWSGTLFKDEMIGHIVEDMDLDYSAAETTVLFLNGEYWGVYSLRERHDIDYVRNNHDANTENIDIIAYDKRVLVEEGTVDEYNRMIHWLEMNSPSSDDFYDKANELIDLEALMDYHIAQFYLANTDFPHNNVEMWKSDSDESLWRYFFFDMDGAMMRMNDDRLSIFIDNNDPLDVPEYSTFIMRRLLENQEFRTKFHLRFLKHLNTSFSPDRVIGIINSYQELYTPLVAEHIYRWSNPTDYHKWLNNTDMVKEFAVQRPVFMMQQFNEYFKDPIVIYPNPSTGYFTIKIPDLQENIKYVIYDLTGKQLTSDALYVQNEIPIQLDLKSGVYILQVEFSGSRYFKKITII